MKKIIAVITTMLITINASALTIKHVSVHGLYSLKIYSPVSSDSYTVIGIPPLDRLLERINQQIADASCDKNAYVQFGYYDNNTDVTTWFNGECKIILPKDETIDVQITPKNCA